MSMIINAPTDQVTTYDVAGQTDVQLNFDFDPSLFRADGTTLIIEYEGHEIRLENFFNADGASGVENFLTQDGQAFSAADLLAAVMGGEPGTAEDIETAADGAAGGSGAGDYSDDPGNLYDGLNALGGQPDAYAHELPEYLEGDDFDLENGDNEIIFESAERWDRFYDNGQPEWEVRVYANQSGESPTANGINAREDSIALEGYLKNLAPIIGTAADNDVLILPDDTEGVALLLEDHRTLTGWGGGPGLVEIETIVGGSGDDVIDLSSSTMTYDEDLTVYGNDGNDNIWTSVGNDTIYGGSGEDNIIGGLGDDFIDGGADNDVIKGSTGNDFLNGGDGHDHIFGGVDNDTINGGSGSDMLEGGSGDDVIHGGTGDDYIVAGSGDDVVNAGTGMFDQVELGSGQDTLSIDASSLISTPDTDGPGGAGSMMEVLDFTVSDDQIDLNGYNILDAELNGGDLALLVGNSAGTEHTWIVLDGIAPADLAQTSVVDCGNWDTSSADTLAQFVAGLA